MIRFTPTTVVTPLSINDASIRASDNLMTELNVTIILDIEFDARIKTVPVKWKN